MSRGVVAVLLAGWALSTALPPSEPGPRENRGAPGPVLQLAPEGEPGRRLLVAGRVFSEDGTTPLPGITIDVHQTDARGDYRPNLLGRARLAGKLVTGQEGQFEIWTIEPGSYPGRDIPAHIHFKVFGPGVSEQFPDDEWFEGDPLLTPALRARVRSNEGRFSPICPLGVDPDGIRRCVRDFRIRRSGV
ncbi:MAG: hypothetical protein ACRD3M_09000 [Thermoanaerobaculia bacterium]